jgi:hypothetical protein
MKKIEDLLPLRENPEKLIIRMKDEPHLKKQLTDLVNKLKSKHPKVKGISIQWAVIAAIKDFVRKYGKD